MPSISITDKFTFGRLLRFAVPSMIMVIFTSLYGIVDGLFVSNFAGDDAFTAVNLFLPLFYILGSMGFLLGSGGCALVGKLLGEKNDDRARGIFTGITIIATVISAVFTAVTLPLMPVIAPLLGATGDVVGHCVTYGRIMLAGIVPFVLQSFFQYFFAVADRPKLGLAITVAAGIVNTVGDFLLVYVAKLGVTGAAIATVVGECVGAVVPVILFCRKTQSLYFTKPVFDFKEIGKACINGTSEMITNIAVSFVSMLYNFQLLKYVGNAGVIAYGTIMYVSFIFVGCFIGFSVGTTPIVSYNYGAKNNDELKSVYKKSLMFYTIAGIVLTAVAEATAYPLALLFVGYDEYLTALTVRAIRIFSVAFLIDGYNIYASAFFTALNNGVVSAVISLSRTLVFQVGALFVMPLLLDVDGIWLATFVAETLSLGVSVAMIFRYGKRYGYR